MCCMSDGDLCTAIKLCLFIDVEKLLVQFHHIITIILTPENSINNKKIMSTNGYLWSAEALSMDLNAGMVASIWGGGRRER